MYRALLVGIVLCGSIGNSNAQVVSTAYGETVITDLILTKSMSNRSQTLKYQSIDGSPFQNDEFFSGEIHLNSGYVQKDIKVRLDLFEGNIQVKVKDETMVMSNAKVVDMIVVNNETYFYYSKYQEKLPVGFYKSYYNGSTRVIGFERVVFKEEERAINSYSEDKPDRFVSMKERVFLVEANGDPIEVISKKKFLKDVEKSSPSLFSYLKKNKLNPGKIDDLVVAASALDNPSAGALDQ